MRKRSRDQGERLLSPSEAAGYAGCTEETVRRICRRGEIGFKFGGRWIIRESELGPLAGYGEDRLPDEK